MSLYFPHHNSFYIHLRRSSTEMCRTNIPSVQGAVAYPYEYTNGKVSSSRSQPQSWCERCIIGDFELGCHEKNVYKVSPPAAS